MFTKISSTYQRSVLILCRSVVVSNCRHKSRFKGRKQKKLDEVTYEYQNVPNPKTTDFEEGEFLPRRLTYLPSGLPQHRGKKPRPWLYKDFRIEIPAPEKPVEQWLDEPQYPEITFDEKAPYVEGSRRIRRDWYKQIRSLPTIDQKMVEIVNKKPFVSIVFCDKTFRYGHLDMAKFNTRTYLVKGILPSVYDEIEVDENDVAAIRNQILDAVRVHYEFERSLNGYWNPSFKLGYQLNLDLCKHRNLLAEISSICQQHLASKGQHLIDAQIDYEAFVRSWWWLSGVNRLSEARIYKRYKIEKIDQATIYEGLNDVQIRSSVPLKKFIETDDPLVTESEIPQFVYSPGKEGYLKGWRYLSTMPGFWNDLNYDEQRVPQDFSFLSIQNRFFFDQIKEKTHISREEVNDHLSFCAILKNFSYLNALSVYHGFTPYDELEYPLMTQDIYTDGHRWFFSAYQLNAHSFHSDVIKNSTKRNICWASGDMELYKDFKDGKFIGVNDDVIRNLIKFYLNKPEFDSNVNYRPYLQPELDTRTEEEKIEHRRILSWRYKNIYEPKDRNLIKANKTIPAEFLFRRKGAPPTIQWRRKYPIRFYDQELAYKYFSL